MVQLIQRHFKGGHEIPQEIMHFRQDDAVQAFPDVFRRVMDEEMKKLTKVIANPDSKKARSMMRNLGF